MRRKILSILTVVVMLFMAVGCRDSSTTSTENSAKNGTEVSVTFKNSTNNFQKVSDINKILLNVKQGDTFIYENKPLSKTLGTWGVNLSLNANAGPYIFETTAYDVGENLLYKGNYETSSVLPSNLILSLNDVSQDNLFSLPPYLKTIEVYSENEQEARVKFTVKNVQKDDLQYKLNVIKETVKSKILAKGDLPIIGCVSPEIGCFSPESGTLSFGDKDEVTFISIYTKPVVNTFEKTISTDLGLGGNSLIDIIKTNLTLENTAGNIVTVPFTLPSYDEQLITINLPPEIQKINVVDETTDFTLTVEIFDEDSSSWTYEWSEIIGANVVGTTATQNPLKLEGYDENINPNLCVKLTVTDNGGASSSIDYCIRGNKKGLIRQDETVTDKNTGLQWQDDTAVKTVLKPWVTRTNYSNGGAGIGSDNTSGDTSTTYCEDLSLNGFYDWRVPLKSELETIIDTQFNPTIDATFQNIASVTILYPNIIYTVNSQSESLDEVGIIKDHVKFRRDSTNAYLYVDEEAYVRCVRDNKLTTVSDLETIYKGLKLTTTLDKDIYSQTDTIKRLYTFTNESNHILKIPINNDFDRPLNLIGTLQFWIERLGNDSDIPSISNVIARDGNKYAAGGFIVKSKEIIQPLEIAESSFSDYSLDNYPLGDYRIYIDYQKIDGSLIETQTLDFEIQ
ncbi:MAG: Unknown protein [uncultured Sulfurovum sp.]|uniref:Lcl C-terminal domain-containing protein n=1 Tax=uncultured Sulfurovum sp. TaxID=269237 RepID=A0A6S6T325_9BACT|nr:MAG: Unknown protein [uncultured Sulfurovum sp.]